MLLFGEQAIKQNHSENCIQIRRASAFSAPLSHIEALPALFCRPPDFTNAFPVFLMPSVTAEWLQGPFSVTEGTEEVILGLPLAG